MKTVIPQAPSPLTYTHLKLKGKVTVELAMGPMSIMKQVINETSGYIVQQGQRGSYWRAISRNEKKYRFI
jgi:hypothetical protein